MSQKFRKQVKLLECLQLFRFGTHAAQFASVVRIHKAESDHSVSGLTRVTLLSAEAVAAAG